MALNTYNSDQSLDETFEGREFHMGSELWTRENLAWVAGIIEGEGYIAARPVNKVDNTKSCALQIQLEMTDKDVVELVALRAGLGRVTGPFRRESIKHHKDTWGWGVYGVEAYALLIAILPWLCERRKNAALNGIKQWLSQPGRGVSSRKLTDDQVRAVRVAVNEENRTIRSVASAFDTSHSTILNIARGIHYKSVPNL